MSNKLTIRRLKNTNFTDLYKKLLFNDSLSDVDFKKLASLILLFDQLDSTVFRKFSYRMLLLYTFTKKDYKRLYEYSINNGLVPVAQYIYQNIINYEDNLYLEFNNIYYELEFELDDMFITTEQKSLLKFLETNTKNTSVMVAPTSYGKTGMIVNIIKNNPKSNICILTPTKSLLGQTKKRILNKMSEKKIITQPEMYNGEEEVICVLTQERLLRLLKENSELVFDLIVVDEAHNLFEKSTSTQNRSVLLATVLLLCYYRNKDLKYKFFSPFIKDSSNLEINFMELNSTEYRVKESIKSEIYYFHNIEERKSFLYDQYINNFFELNNNNSYINSISDVITYNATNKNIIYLNKPIDTVAFAKELSNNIQTIQNNRIEKIKNDISEYIHPEYSLIQFLEKGIVYHNGSVPEQIRYYLENIYSFVDEFKYIITTSTLLEGINIPALKMFILNSNRGLGQFTPATFKNLVGRVCRFNEIFDNENGDLKRLLPEIHFIKGKYAASTDRKENLVKNFKLSIEKEENITDTVSNPLLRKSDANISIKKEANEFVANLNDEIIENYDGNKAQTQVGLLCYENNINIFNIVENENQLTEEINRVHLVSSIDNLFSVISNIFFGKISEEINDNKLKRLRNPVAVNFYKMLMNWRINNYSYSQMISSMIKFWESQPTNYLAYVGNWGDQKRSGYRKLWTYINKKSHYQKINYAIVRIKEEMDFLDNEIIKYIEVLNSVSKVPESIYLAAKYGTDDSEKIKMLNYGLSNTLVELLTSKYLDYFQIIEERIIFADDILEKMSENNENGILMNEIRMNSAL